MAEPITPHNPEVTRTGDTRVECAGPVFSRHPKVWLTMVDDAHGNPSHVVCPYCSHVFQYDPALPARHRGH
jgi:uncharacterized Zn-finger protein